MSKILKIEIHKWIKSYRKQLCQLLGCIFTTSFCTFLQPLVIRKITDDGMNKGNMSYIVSFSFCLLMLSCILQLINLYQTKILVGIHNDSVRLLYEKAYFKLGKLKISYFEKMNGTEILNMITNDISSISLLTDKIAAITLTSVLQFFGGIIGLLFLNWPMALCVILLIPAKYFLISILSKEKCISSEKFINSNRECVGWLADCSDGIYEMKLWNLFGLKIGEFRKLQKENIRLYTKNELLDQYKNISICIIDAVTMFALYLFSGYLIIRGKFSIGTAFAFITYVGYISSPISFFVDIKYFFSEIKPALYRFYNFMCEEEEIYNLEKKSKNEEATNHQSTSELVLAITDLSFKYDSDEWILKNVNLKLRHGEKIAIIGENGSGKSTLLKLISGFLEPNSGKIEINGIDVKTLGVEKLREHIAVVTQNPYLFNGTIRENVNLDGKAKEKKVIEACKNSGAMTFISKLHGKLDQHIGKKGTQLSGGEKQKVVVARALLKEAEIVLLDEATTGYDKLSNEIMMKNICEKFKDKTMIFITHNEKELKNIDKVYKLSGGLINEIEKKG